MKKFLTWQEYLEEYDSFQEAYENYYELYQEMERLNNIINELEKKINDFDVFKEFTFPLMKKWEEEQVKSSINYEWTKLIKEPFLDKLNELKENK